jgi:hypothetical protein
MTKETIIERTLTAIHQLPMDKAQEISDFADVLFTRYAEDQLTQGLPKILANSQAFDFLNEEEDLYSLADAKEVYHA